MTDNRRCKNRKALLCTLLFTVHGTSLAAPEVALISGDGYEPSNLARNQAVPAGTRVSADDNTIVVLVNRWNMGNQQFCEDWIIIRGMSHTIASGTPANCDSIGNGNELGEIMDGRNAVLQVRTLQFSDSKSDNPLPVSTQRLRQDLRRLEDRSDGQPHKTVQVQAPKAGVLVAQAPTPVSEPESGCFGIVQGKIAWDYQGHKTWAPSNIERLCRGTTSAKQPAKCFNSVMHRGVTAGDVDGWTSSKALDLCEGTSNANKTIQCYEAALKKGIGRDDAIAECETR